LRSSVGYRSTCTFSQMRHEGLVLLSSTGHGLHGTLIDVELGVVKLWNINGLHHSCMLVVHNLVCVMRGIEDAELGFVAHKTASFPVSRTRVLSYSSFN